MILGIKPNITDYTLLYIGQPFCSSKTTGVVEYLSNGIVADNHKDFKELRYNECLMNFSGNGKNGASEGRITHAFQLKSAYENNLMPYTNYTFDFKVSISWMEAVLVCLAEIKYLTK